MAWLVLVLVLGSAAALPVPAQAAPQGKIGYTGPDGTIYRVGTGGVPAVPVTSDAGESRAYRQVTWAPDGRKLAFVAYRQAPGGAVLAAVCTANASGGDLREIHTTDAAAPFYLFWAPDSERVSFLEVAGGRLTLKIAPWRGGPAVVAGTGQPCDWDWMPDGRSFAAAVVVPRGGNTLVRLGDPSMHLAVVDLRGAVLRSLAAIQGIAAFSWSPDGKRLVAFVPRLLGTAEPVVVFGVFVVGAASGESTLAALIRPTEEFLTGVAPFYDQYLRSSTLWSPDGAHVVLNAIGEDGKSGVYLLDVDKRGPLRLLAEGTLPFWSPR
jgi:Tol biopolymer transport system component